MGLKAIEELRLDNVGLITFFEKHKPHYKTLAQDAYDYTAKILESTSLPVRQDDVAGLLVAALEVDKLLTDARAKKAKQDYWVRFFTNLVLDRLWNEISNG